MSKELEALTEMILLICKQQPNTYDKIMEHKRTIENSLKDYENLKEENKLLRENLVNLDDTYFETWYACENLKENSNYALMFVDDIYCLVDTKDNKFEVIDNYKINSKGIIDNGTKKKLKAFDEIIKEKGLSINDIAFIKNGESWETYVETMKQLYWGDEHLYKVLKTKEEYDLLKEVLL